MPIEQLERVGEFVTLKEAARAKGTSVNALYMWLRWNQVPYRKIGRTIVVRQVDIVAYRPRGR